MVLDKHCPRGSGLQVHQPCLLFSKPQWALRAIRPASEPLSQLPGTPRECRYLHHGHARAGEHTADLPVHLTHYTDKGLEDQIEDTATPESQRQVQGRLELSLSPPLPTFSSAAHSIAAQLLRHRSFPEPGQGPYTLLHFPMVSVGKGQG